MLAETSTCQNEVSTSRSDPLIRNSIRLGIAALATFAVTFGPAAIAQAKVHCHPAGAQALASDSFARVYGLNGHAYVCIKSSGKATQLHDASPTTNKFAIAGKFVAWSSDPDTSDPNNPQQGPANSVVTVMRISDRFVNDYWYPFQTNENIDKVVVASDGAAAWAMTPNPADGSFTEVQGTDRNNHPPDQFSDDHADLNGNSLKISGKTVTWQYTDGTSGSQTLF
jgi:hypothetical protein